MKIPGLYFPLEDQASSGGRDFVNIDTPLPC